MSEASHRMRQRHDAKQLLKKLFENPRNVVVIHYSCESFYERPDGSSPRITSIAVRNLGSGQTVSFSIHQLAEREGVQVSEINSSYDKFEKKMLKEFYDYVSKHQSHLWLHWNMRDANYGFAALAHRYKVLGGTPVDIHESNLCDLARVLVGLYGTSYIGHPRLAHLVALNNISNKDALTGEQEAKAFVDGEYVKLHLSTLRKVDMLANIAGRTADGKIQTNARRKEIYGDYFAYGIEWLKDHPVGVLLTVLGSIASIIGLVSLFGL